MPDDLTALAVDEGPGAFMPRPEHASDEALARKAVRTAPLRSPRAAARPDPDRKAKRKAARAARRKNRRVQ
jgi:hypothetical protein